MIPPANRCQVKGALTSATLPGGCRLRRVLLSLVRLSLLFLQLRFDVFVRRRRRDFSRGSAVSGAFGRPPLPWFPRHPRSTGKKHGRRLRCWKRTPAHRSLTSGFVKGLKWNLRTERPSKRRGRAFPSTFLRSLGSFCVQEGRSSEQTISEVSITSNHPVRNVVGA